MGLQKGAQIAYALWSEDTLSSPSSFNGEKIPRNNRALSPWTSQVRAFGLGGTGHWPVLSGDSPDSRARSSLRDRRTFERKTRRPVAAEDGQVGRSTQSIFWNRRLVILTALHVLGSWRGPG